MKDGTETDVDCGGASCPPCLPNKMCDVPADCLEHVCTGGRCAVPSCTDGVKNGTETDVDCGGGSCPPCPPGDTCLLSGDCQSMACDGGLCG